MKLHTRKQYVYEKPTSSFYLREKLKEKLKAFFECNLLPRASKAILQRGILCALPFLCARFWEKLLLPNKLENLDRLF
jgi:hypothetical protein